MFERKKKEEHALPTHGKCRNYTRVNTMPIKLNNFKWVFRRHHQCLLSTDFNDRNL